MRDGLILLISGLIGIGGVVLWWQSSHVQPPPQHVVTVVKTEPPPAPKPVAARPKPAPAPVEAPVVVPQEAPPKPEPAPVAVVARDPLPFPSSEEIANGAPEQAVTTKFGDPTLSLVTTSRGRVQGTYVYAREKGREATVIKLLDGKVASAYSKSAPVAASGLSIPRQQHAAQ